MAGGLARIGVDVGGTFTDVVSVVDGTIKVTKVPSTPAAPDQGVIDGIDGALETGTIAPEQVTAVSHGTTVATNAVLEGELAETALITTEGFRDVLEIGRGDRPSLYDLTVKRPDPVIPRDHRLTVAERVDERGEIRQSLTDTEISAVAMKLETLDVDAIAICLLFAYEQPAHEQRLVDGLREHGIECPISRSSRIHPEIREYERTLATAINAALQPIMSRYLTSVVDRIDDLGIDVPVTMMQSNGGTVIADHLAKQPVRSLLSGPAAGIEGAGYVASELGEKQIITMDMGGTSCDVSFVVNGEATVSTGVDVGPYPVSVPMVDVHTIGAGGGSIAWLDEGDALRVGPQSAGATPGPICYGRGGTDPTVTDAHALLGRIEADRVAPASAVETNSLSRAFAPLGEAMNASPEAAASGVLSVADASMARAIRVVTVERGFDPRECSLVAFGGAGPLHGSSVAATLGVPRVLIPPSAGVLSALGLLVADRVYDFSTSHVRPLTEVDWAAVSEKIAYFAEQGREQLREAGVSSAAIDIDCSLDLRYRGQAYEVSVPVPLDLASTTELANRFHAAHEQRYGHQSPDEPVELVTIRVQARGAVKGPALSYDPPADPSLTPRTERSVWFEGAWQDTAVFGRRQLPTDEPIAGPAIIDGPGTTIVVRPKDVATVDETGTIVLEVAP